MFSVQQHIEALIFTSEQPITAPEIKDCIEAVFSITLSTQEMELEIQQLVEKYRTDDHFFELSQIDGGLIFLTKKDFAETVGLITQQKNRKRLSQPAMETLAIIAYQQPVTRIEVEQIRGVNCEYSIQKLLEKELIQIEGKSNGVGNPLIYATSPMFMNYFKLNSLSELPKLKDIPE